MYHLAWLCTWMGRKRHVYDLRGCVSGTSSDAKDMFNQVSQGQLQQSSTTALVAHLPLTQRQPGPKFPKAPLLVRQISGQSIKSVSETGWASPLEHEFCAMLAVPIIP